MTVPASPPVDLSELTFRPMLPTDTDLRLFHECMAANGSPRTMSMLQWQFLQPPAGPLLIDLAVTPGPEPRLAAIYAVVPVHMRANGKRVLGLQSLNTLTDAEYRGRGLFVSMAKTLYARSVEAGAQMVYGFPNGNSIHGFLKHLEWKTLNPMPILVKPLRSGYLLRKAGARAVAGMMDVPLGRFRAPKLSAPYSLQTFDAPTPEFDVVWERFAANIGFGVERSAEYLAWRLRRPEANYEIAALLSGSALAGYVITGTVTSPDGSLVGKIMDLVFDPAYPTASEVLIDEALHRLSSRGCSVAWAWNFEHSPNHSALRGAGFMSLPDRLQTTETNVGARALVPLPNYDNRANWYISLFDSDTD